MRADDTAGLVPKDGWQRLSCADGSKRSRLYDWALIGTAAPGITFSCASPSLPKRKGRLELTFFRCWSLRPGHTPRQTP